MKYKELNPDSKLQDLHIKINLIKKVVIRVFPFTWTLFPSLECVKQERTDLINIGNDYTLQPRGLKKHVSVYWMCFVIENLFTYNVITEVGIIYPAGYVLENDPLPNRVKRMSALLETDWFS